ncbi:MAG TPA: ribonuclease III [Acidobacteriaceae bacterium]
MAPRDPSELEELLGHRFAQAHLLAEALTHASLRHEARSSAAPVPDNERLEFLGDAIVGLAVAELLYRRYPELDEGELTRLRAALISRKHLGHVGASIDLGSFLRLGTAEERSGGRRKAVLLANCVEALVAALYLEAGLAPAAALIERLIVAPYVDALRTEMREHRSIGDYKTALQELLQARGTAQPHYAVQAESGPDHRKHFLVEARIARTLADDEEPTLTAQGQGTTKKKAEQEAARHLYERLTTAGRSSLKQDPAASASQDSSRHLAQPSAGPLLEATPPQPAGKRG